MDLSIFLWAIPVIIILGVMYLLRHIKNFQSATLYNAIEQTKTCAVLLDKANNITRITDATCELLKIERFETISKHASCLFDDKDKYQITISLKNLDNSGFEQANNISIKTKTGQCHILCKMCKVDTIFNFHHKALIFQDRTDLVKHINLLEKSEHVLQEYSKLFRSSFDNSFLPAVIIQPDGTIANYNKSFHSLLRKPEINFKQDNLFNMLNIEKFTFNEKLRKNQCFESTINIKNLEKNIVFNLHKIVTPEKSEFILCQMQDITKQKQAESLRKKLESEIKQSRKVEYLGELAGVISHEFNNALMPIISFSKAVEESLPAKYKEQKEQLKKVIAASDHAKQMINQIMSIKHIDFHKTEEVDINELIERNLHKLNLPKTISLNVNNNVEKPLTIANYEILGNTFVNLIKNSSQAIGSKKGEITIDISKTKFAEDIPKSLNNHPIRPTKEYIQFSINDNGSGIQQEDIKSIFNPFFTTKHFNKHIGTGLTYVYNCLDKYNAPFVIKNQPGEGVSISIFFPAL